MHRLQRDEGIQPFAVRDRIGWQLDEVPEPEMFSCLC
jgi:hypothetical protein